MNTGAHRQACLRNRPKYWRSSGDDKTDDFMASLLKPSARSDLYFRVNVCEFMVYAFS